MALNIFPKKAKTRVGKVATVQAPIKTKESTGIFFESSPMVVRPYITEKASMLAEKNQYVFEVFPKATKNGIRKSVEQLYHVDVEKVRVVTIPLKHIRYGGRMGVKKGFKKAIVQIKEGQKIEILPK